MKSKSSSPLHPAIALAVALLALTAASCASIPTPAQNSDESLVIGYLVVDFPDGYFSAPPRSLDQGVWVELTNTTKNQKFKVQTGEDGCFYFLSNGRDSYSITGFHHFDSGSGKGSTEIRGPLTYDFDTSASCVRYIGHFAVHYTKPRFVESAIDKARLWDFTINRIRDVKPDVAREYLQKSVWASYEVL